MSQLELEVWQRLSPLALLFLIVNGTFKFVRENLAIFAGAGAGVAFLDWLGLREALLGGGVMLLLIVVGAVIFHQRFRFRIEGDGIRVRKGLFEKKDLRIRFARVQNVELSQPFYFRPFGLVRFKLQTPGAVETEVELPGIGIDLANQLRDRIGQHGEAEPVPVDEPETGNETEPVFAPGPGRLFRHGLASNQVWVLAGVLGWMIGSLSERFESWLDESGINAAFKGVLDAGWTGAFVLVVLLFVGLFTLSGVISLIRFYQYRLSDTGERLVAHGGLLDRREQTLRREKLTGVMLNQTAIGRLLGMWYILGRQASSTDVEVEFKQSRFLVPGLRAPDLDLAGKLMPDLPSPTAFEPISRRFRRFFWTRVTLLAAIGLVLPWFRVGEGWVGVSLSIAGVGVVLLLIHLRWRMWGWSRSGDFCWVQQGLLGRRRDGFCLRQVQQVSVTVSPYLRRHGLATLEFTLPHGAVTIPFLDLEVAAELANRAAFVAETANVHQI